MINKKLLQHALYFAEEGNENYHIEDFEVIKFKQKKSNLEIYFDEDLMDCAEWNMYELGILLKEYIEDYADNLGLRGVWIDLNDLSKDEGYYFRHCNEVVEGLIEYENGSTK